MRSECSCGTPHKTSVLTTGSTDATGRYSLNAPGPGSYRVRVLLPASQPGSGFTVLDANCDVFLFKDRCDSDINPSGGDLGFSRIYTFTGSSNVTSIDAGLINIVPISTPTGTPTPPSTVTPTPTPTGTPILTPVPQFDILLPVLIKQ